MKNIFLLFTTFFLTISLNAQVIQPWCSGSPSGGGPTALGSVASTLQNTNTYKVRVYLHIIQDGNGNGGVSITEAQQVVTDLNNYFSNTNADICFESAGITFLPSDDFYGVLSDRCIGGAPVPGTTDDNDVDELFNTNAHADGIDIYILPDEFNQNPVGLAQSIPGTAMYIGGRVANYNNELVRNIYSLPHEMGHCLGLFHPYHGTAQGANGIFCNGMICNLCTEVGGTNGNGEECGDYVVDTPPDPLFTNFDDFDYANCEWDNQNYNPDAENFMALTWYTCATRFTPDQILRMKNFLEDIPLMQNVVISKNSCTAPQSRPTVKQEVYPLFNNSEWLHSGVQETEGYLPIRFYENGDTLILGKSYKRIIKENTSIEGLTSSPFHTGLRRDTSFLREDLINKQIWRLDQSNTEILEFDFNLKPGDIHPTRNNYTLTKVDTLQTEEGPRRRFTFDRTTPSPFLFYIVWIEGIGNINKTNPLDAGHALMEADSTFQGLLCMTQNGNLIYNQGHINLGLPGGCANNITVDTRVATILDPALKVFPNPANNYLYLSSESLVGQEVDIVIHDLLGQRLSMQKVRLSKNHKISIAQLGKGAYILSISTNQGLQSLRFIKQ